MKALTILQPYASLIASGNKRVENRTWRTGYRGRLAIHAGKSRTYMSGTRFGCVLPASLPYGAVVATCQLSECIFIDVATDRSRLPGRLDWLPEHQHTEGPWCWVLENVEPVDPPLKARGSQGLWDVDLGELEPERQNTLF